ncbi:MAG: DUF2141 domain-containing protein [Amphiplicatus sp.]
MTKARIAPARTAPAAALIALAFFAPEANGAKRDVVEPPHLSCTGAPNEVLVVVENVKESVGLITAELYRDDEETFLTKEGREQRMQVAARSPRTEFCMHAPQATSYAMAIYHDENANMKFDKGAFGLPAEPYGVSNNPRMRFGPPKIAEALFHVNGDGATVEIKLNH